MKDERTKRFRLQRKTGTLEKCTKCKEFQLSLSRCSQTDEEGRRKVFMKYRGHLILQQLERLSYYSRRLLAKWYPHLYLSVIIDGSTQSVHKSPNLGCFVKGAAFKTVECSLIGVIFHGHGTYLYPIPPYTPKNSSTTCSLTVWLNSGKIFLCTEKTGCQKPCLFRWITVLEITRIQHFLRGVLPWLHWVILTLLCQAS